MNLVPVLLAAALPVVALLPAPALDAAPSPALVVEVDDCECEPVLKLEPYEQGSNWLPWQLSWTTDDGNQNGICNVESCTGEDGPRPCKGKFRIEVTWPQQPTPPCITWAPVSYRPEGTQIFYQQGTLDLSHTFVPIDGAGGTEVPCKSKAETEEEMECESDDTITLIHVRCGIGGGAMHEKFIKVRECCKTCKATVE